MKNTGKHAGVIASVVTAIAVCAIAWQAEFRRCHEWGLPLDDAWIHCQIARNLIEGAGWGINAGAPVQCSSGPLWTLLVAAGFAVCGVHVWVVKALCAAVFAMTAVCTGRLAGTMGGNRALGAGLAATCGTLAWHGLSGMETSLAGLLILIAVERACNRKHGRLAALLASLAMFARPEALVVALLIVVDGLRKSRRHATYRLAVTVAMLGVYALFNTLISGTLLPTTFAAKVGSLGFVRSLVAGDLYQAGLSLTLAPYVWLVRWVSFLGFMDVGLLFLAVIGGVAVIRCPARMWLPVVLLVAYPVARGVFAPAMNPSFHNGRYVCVLLPVVLALASVGVAAFVRPRLRASLKTDSAIAVAALFAVALVAVGLELGVPATGRNPLPALGSLLWGGRISSGIDPSLQTERVGLLLIALSVPVVLAVNHAPRRVVRTGTIVLLALAAVLQAHRLTGLPRAYAADVLDIQSMDVAMGRWVAENTKPTDQIAVNDIGAIAFFGRRPIVDLLGLATPAVAPFGTPRQLATLVPARRLAPPLGIAFTSWFASWFERTSLIIPLHSVQLANVSILAGHQAVAFRADWPTYDHFYSDSLILALDPLAQPRTAARAEDRLRRSMGLLTRSELFARAGDFERRRRDWLDAEEYYRRALRLDPAEETAWSGLVSVGRQVRPSAQVEALLREQAERRPLDPGSQEMLGDWLASTARSGGASDAWSAALRLYPDSRSLLAKLERASQALGDSAAARVYHNDLAKLDEHGVE